MPVRRSDKHFALSGGWERMTAAAQRDSQKWGRPEFQTTKRPLGKAPKQQKSSTPILMY